MPFKSDAQRRWAHTDEGVKALGGTAKVAEWDSASKGMDLPERKSQFKAGVEKPAAAPHSEKIRFK